jgi:nitrous oxide reductase accessory protein NosL
MSPISKYAFKNLNDAKKFQKKHGGKIVDFYSAWQIAKKDFK